MVITVCQTDFQVVYCLASSQPCDPARQEVCIVKNIVLCVSKTFSLNPELIQLYRSTIPFVSSSHPIHWHRVHFSDGKESDPFHL